MGIDNWLEHSVTVAEKERVHFDRFLVNDPSKEAAAALIEAARARLHAEWTTREEKGRRRRYGRRRNGIGE